MKIVFYYYIRYQLLMVAGFILTRIGLPLNDNMLYVAFILYNLVAILLGVSRPLENRRDISYKKLLKFMLLFSTLGNLVLLYYAYVPTNERVLMLIVNVAEWILMRPRYDKEKEIIDKSIEEYFKTHKR